jgi:hypothetical protein
MVSFIIIISLFALRTAVYLGYVLLMFLARELRETLKLRHITPEV